MDTVDVPSPVTATQWRVLPGDDGEAPRLVLRSGDLSMDVPIMGGLSDALRTIITEDAVTPGDLHRPDVDTPRPSAGPDHTREDDLDIDLETLDLDALTDEELALLAGQGATREQDQDGLPGTPLTRMTLVPQMKAWWDLLTPRQQRIAYGVLAALLLAIAIFANLR